VAYNFQGGNDNWWKNLILGNANAQGNPYSTPPPADKWNAYTQGLQGAVQSIFQGFGQQPQQQSGGGGNPAAGILADYLSKMRGDVNAASVADAASRDAAIKRLVISYGQVPDFASLGLDDKSAKIIANALDQKTKDLAAKNTAEGTSVYARMLKDNAVANRRIPAMLAGRGLLRSGQTVSDLAEQAQGYKNQSFDAMNSMLNEATGAIGQYAAAERARQEQLAQMELQAALAAAQEGYGGGYPSDPGAPPPAAPPGGAPTYKFGQPVFYMRGRPVYGGGTPQDPYRFRGGGVRWY
jgi:hypothetical protein